MTIKKYNILTGKLNNSIKVKLKDLTGSHFLFYKKGESVEELQKKCGKTKNEYTRNTPTNKEELNTVAFFFKKEKLNWFKKIISSLIIKTFGKPYDWDKLRDQMKNTGYDPEIKPIVIAPPTDNTVPYRLLDGNHRLRILRELYGNEYEIEVRYGRKSIIQKVLKSVLGLRIGGYEVAKDKPKPCAWCTVENIKKYLKTLIRDKSKILEFIKILSTIIYMLFLNIYYFIWIFGSIILFPIVTNLLNYVGYEPNNIAKWLPIKQPLLRQTIMTVLINIPLLVAAIPAAIASILMIINGPIEFLVYGAIIHICDRIDTKKEELND
jgi:hypothetical protein